MAPWGSGAAPSSFVALPLGGMPRRSPTAPSASTAALSRRLLRPRRRPQLPLARRPATATTPSREELAQRRQRKYSASERTVNAQGLSFLERVAVGRDCQKDHEKRFQAFLDWCLTGSHPTRTLSDLDSSLVEWMNESFFDGAPSAGGSMMIAAGKYAKGLGTKGNAFPRAVRAVKGRRRLAPPGSRLPLPWEVLCWKVEHMVVSNQRHAALLTMTLFIFYLRPKELSGCLCS